MCIFSVPLWLPFYFKPKRFWDRYLKKGVSKSIVDVIKYPNFQLYGAYYATVTGGETHLNIQVRLFIHHTIWFSKITCYEKKILAVWCLTNSFYIVWEVPIFRVFLVCIFPHSHWIRRDTPYLYVFSSIAGKYRPEKIQIRKLFTHW